MEVLVLDGKSYVKASKAAKDLGYATDYVGQLCRSGQVDAHLIGRTWYVNQDKLGIHRVEKKRMSRVKAREQAKKTIEEHRIKVREARNPYKNIDIHYEDDPSELIPETKKLVIKSSLPDALQDPESSEDNTQSKRKRLAVTSSVEDRVDISAGYEKGDETEILNAGDKVIMSGALTVVDVTDGPIDSDIITLTPSRIRKSEKLNRSVINTVLEEASEPVEATVAEEQGIEANPLQTRTHFRDRLLKNEAIAEEVTETITEEVKEVTPTGNPTIIPHVLTILFLIALTVATFPVSVVMTYTIDASVQMKTSFKYTPMQTIQIIQSKI